MRASFAFALNSGMSALDTICRLVNDGQEIVAGDDIYGGWFRNVLVSVSSDFLFD